MIKNNLKKKIIFSKIIEIKLIPFYNELIYNNELWWSQEELYQIRKETIEEIYNLMTIHPSMQLYDAKKLLYQPNNIRYDPNNFY